MENKQLAAAFARARRDSYGRIVSASRALEWARDALARVNQAEAKEAAARLALTEFWQSLGKREPKRYAPEGERLAALRIESATAVSALSNARKQAGYYTGQGTVWAKRSLSYGRSTTHGQFWADKPEELLRNIERAHSVDRRFPEGYFDNFHGESFRNGDGLCYGVIGQKRGRAGRARGVAVYYSGHAFGCNDVVQFDLARPLIDTDSDAARREAARYADGEAEKAAQEAREFSAAYGAGNAWAEKREEESELRSKALALLRERKAASKLADSFPGLCDAIRGRISDLLESIRESREEREKLARGDGPGNLYFYQGDARLREAFCDGAGLSVFPA